MTFLEVSSLFGIFGQAMVARQIGGNGDRGGMVSSCAKDSVQILRIEEELQEASNSLLRF
jgi:hypothetical protein